MHGVARRDQGRLPALEHSVLTLSLDPARSAVKPRVPRDQDRLILPCQRRPPGDQPRLVAALFGPALLIAHDLQAPDQARQLAVLEQVLHAGPCMAKQVRPGGVDENQDTARCQLGRDHLEQRAARGTGRRRPGATAPAGKAPAPGRSPGFATAPPRHSPHPGPGQSPTGETSATVTSRPRRASQTALAPAPPARSRARPCRGSLAPGQPGKAAARGAAPLVRDTWHPSESGQACSSVNCVLTIALTPARRVRSPPLEIRRVPGRSPVQETAGQNRPSSVRSHQSREPHRVNR